MKVCIKAGRKIMMGGPLLCGGAVLDLPEDEAKALIESGVVEAVKPASKPKKKKAKTSEE